LRRIIIPHTGDDAVTRETDDLPIPGSSEFPEDRRAPHRVANDQGTGNGAATALSKMRMIERNKSEWQRRYEHPSGE
jgi:hypothetical protein